MKHITSPAFSFMLQLNDGFQTLTTVCFIVILLVTLLVAQSVQKIKVSDDERL